MASVCLLDREEQLDALSSACDDACRDAGSLTIIRAPAGAGKTALLTAAAEDASARGLRTLGARASQLDHAFAFGVVHQLVEPVLRDATAEERKRLFSGAAGRAEALFGRELPDAQPDYGVLSGLFWLLSNIAEDRPLFLYVDDLQWADAPSLRLLEFLARRIGDLPIALVCTWRPGDPFLEPELVEMLHASATRTLVLEPLSMESAGTLLERALGTPPTEDFRQAAWGATGGNPLLTTVIAREAAEQGLRGTAAEASRVVALAARGIAPAVERRLNGLGQDGTAVATAAAVLGDRAHTNDVAALSGLTPRQSRAVRSRLIDAQILSDGGWDYVHPLMRAAVLAMSDEAKIEELHRQAAALLRAARAHPAEVAVHWLAVPPNGDADAVADLRIAARSAISEGAVSTAIELLRRALAEDLTEDRAALLLELAELEIRVFAPEGISRMRQALAQDLTSDDDARGRAALGIALSAMDPHAAITEIETARKLTHDPRLRLQLDAAELEALLFVDAFGARRASRLAQIRDAESPSAVELAHLACAVGLSGGDAAHVVEIAEQSIGDGQAIRDVGLGGATWHLLGHALRFAEAPVASRRLLQILEREVRAHGLRVAGAFVDQSWGYWHRDFGSVARGFAHAESAYDALDDVGVPSSIVAVSSVVAECLVLLDRAVEAEELLDAVPFDSVDGTFNELTAYSARGFVRAAAGHYDQAESDLRRVMEIVDRHGWNAPPTTQDRVRFAEILIATDRSANVISLTDDALTRAQGAGTRGAEGMLLRVRAAAFDGDERLSTLRASVQALAESPLRLEHGRALLALGSELRRCGELSEARTQLYEALDAAMLTESTWLANLARGELIASGGRPRRMRSRGVEALTASERRVAELAAEGLGNQAIAERLWLSKKTVEYHLGRVYAKLGITSRVALPQALSTDSSRQRVGKRSTVKPSRR